MSGLIADHIKVVVFDHDDTLVGTIGPKRQQHKYIAKKHYNKDLTDAEIKMHWGKPFVEMMCLIYGTDDGGQALAYNTACHEDFPKELFAGTVDVLKHMKSKGLMVGVVTATIRFSFEHDLTLHKIPMSLIDYTQTSEDTSFHKPDPKVFEPLQAWLRARSISPNEVLYIGDGLHDMKAALGAGFNFLGVETGLVTSEQFTSAGAKSIPNVAQLLKN